MTKTTTRRLSTRTLLATASLLLMGGAASFWSPHAKAADAKPHDHRSAHAVAGQKPNGSGVQFTADTPKAMPMGQATKMTINFAAAGAPDAKASVRLPEGVAATRVDGSALTDIALNADRPTRIDLWITPRDDGTQYLDVTTTRQGRTSVQSVALKVGTGAVKLKPNGTLITTPSGEKIVSMPAQ